MISRDTRGTHLIIKKIFFNIGEYNFQNFKIFDFSILKKIHFPQNVHTFENVFLHDEKIFLTRVFFMIKYVPLVSLEII